jgi:hypothetical protein
MVNGWPLWTGFGLIVFLIAKSHTSDGVAVAVRVGVLVGFGFTP